MPIPTAFHERTLALCESLNYREWSGYYTVSAYEAHHEHEYNAIRNAAALIDVSPLFKYRVRGPDATKLVDRVVTRDMRKVKVGRMIYTPWCDEGGKIIDDADSLASGGEHLPVDRCGPEPEMGFTRTHGAWMFKSRTFLTRSQLSPCRVRHPGGCLPGLVDDGDILNLEYFGVFSGQLAGVRVDISRSGYTGDLGYELWIPREHSLRVWGCLD